MKCLSMVELQSCASLSALCGIEEEVKEDSVNVVAEISAELQRERERNAELMERISFLEAQIQERESCKESIPNNEQGCLATKERFFRTFKRQKTENTSAAEDGNITEGERASMEKHSSDISGIALNPEAPLVNWMSRDDKIHLLHYDKLKDSDSAVNCDDTDDSEEDYGYCEEDDTNTNYKNREMDENLKGFSEVKEKLHEGVNQLMDMSDLQSSYGSQNELKSQNESQVTNEDSKIDCITTNTRPDHEKTDLGNDEKKDSMKIEGCKTLPEALASQKKALRTGAGSVSLYKKPLKVPFCPKEVKRMLESDALLLNNAQSHTMRKIIVFASLGIRHGCEDMHELDFNHFTVLRKGEPYVSSKDPGEHVLYENPGVRRKVFYPNSENPMLCPVQILEEEKAMRPSDPGCPSYLFLCIKYGGRTRNLPQNEYVRQRMGRNKLKSFGPVMCRMAMLVHIRSGSFFFKALGITLLFMAGFPDDLVQKETKYRNLDLLQKYYRTDKKAEGEDLFLSHTLICDAASPSSQQLTEKPASTRCKGRKQTGSKKPHGLPRSSFQQSIPLSSVPPAQVGITGYTSIQTHAMAACQSTAYQTPEDGLQLTNSKYPGTNVSYHNQTPSHMFPPYPANAFMPMIYWPPPSTYPPGLYPTTTYGYQSFPSSSNYMSINPQPHYNYSYHASSPTILKTVEGSGKNNLILEEADSDSDSSSSSTEPKQVLPSCSK